MSAHAKLSASGSHRWLNCPGSVKAESSLPDKDSFASSEGTAAHELAEHCLVNSVHADSLIGQTFNGFIVDNYMSSYVQQYVDYVKSFSGEHMYEQRVDFSGHVPKGFGTCDALIFQRNGTLRVIDLKYGQGVKVYAENNSQAMLYALGAYEDYNMVFDIEHIEIAIVQPRLDHIDEWSISVKELLSWAQTVKTKAKQCLTDDAPRVPGESQCKFCKFKAQCPEQKALTENTLLVMFDDIEPSALKSPDGLTDEQLALALHNKKLIEGWLSAVESHIRDRLESGTGFKGYKLVEGRSLRKWGNEEEAATALSELLDEDKLYTRKLISVAQAEKILGKTKKAEINDLIVKPSGAPTLVPESDKRPSINIQINDFDAC